MPRRRPVGPGIGYSVGLSLVVFWGYSISSIDLEMKILEDLYIEVSRSILVVVQGYSIVQRVSRGNIKCQLIVPPVLVENKKKPFKRSNFQTQ